MQDKIIAIGEKVCTNCRGKGNTIHTPVNYAPCKTCNGTGMEGIVYMTLKELITSLGKTFKLDE